MDNSHHFSTAVAVRIVGDFDKADESMQPVVITQFLSGIPGQHATTPREGTTLQVSSLLHA